MLCIVWYLRKRIANLFFHYCLFFLAQWRTPHDILGPALFHPAWNLILSVFAFLVHTAGKGGTRSPGSAFWPRAMQASHTQPGMFQRHLKELTVHLE